VPAAVAYLDEAVHNYRAATTRGDLPEFLQPGFATGLEPLSVVALDDGEPQDTYFEYVAEGDEQADSFKADTRVSRRSGR
jgi:hypothetical protein